MKWFSWRKKKAEMTVQAKAAGIAQAVDDRGWSKIFDWTPGAWQTNSPYNKAESVLTHPTVFACQTLIANDISKLPLTIQKMAAGVWEADAVHPYAPLLRRPNWYQTRQQFIEYWALSKLSTGNAYALLEHNGRYITALHLLDPLKVCPLVAANGDVFYRIDQDQLTPFEEGQIVVPATRIIHDRFNCLYHPLVGTSPIYAAGTTALAGMAGIKNMQRFLGNASNPGGILTAPGSISDSTAERLKKYFNENFTGDNAGKIAVAGDGLAFNQLRMSNVDAQLIETLRWDDEKIASVYHVPGYMIGIGATPAYNNIEALSQGYYSQCLQTLIEAIEAVLDIGLSLTTDQRTQIGTEALFRMDSKTQLEALQIGIGSGLISPNEGRARINLPPVVGGKYPYMQQQNYSLEALAKRDEKDPLGTTPAPAPQPDPEPADPADDAQEDQDEMDQALAVFDQLVKNEQPCLTIRHVING